MLPKESPAGLSSLADFKSKRHFTLQLPWPFVISWMAAQPRLHGPCYELHLWFWEIGCPPLFPCSAHSKVKLPGFIFFIWNSWQTGWASRNPNRRQVCNKPRLTPWVLCCQFTPNTGTVTEFPGNPAEAPSASSGFHFVVEKACNHIQLYAF